MTKHLFILFLFAVFIVKPTFAQNDTVKANKIRKNTFFLRLGTVSNLSANGTLSSLYSFDYDRVIWIVKKFKFTTSVGLSLPFAIELPINFNFLLGNKFCWESGLGITFYKPLGSDKFYKDYMFFTINPAGIRYNGKKGFATFLKLGYFIGDLRWIGGDVFYDSYFKKSFFSSCININYGIGYAF